MNCPNCGAPLRPEPGMEYLVCDACHGIHHPEPNEDGIIVLGTATSLNCPVCRDPLVEALVLRQSVQHCPGCRGTLLSADVLLFLLDYLQFKEGTKPPPRRFDEAELNRVVECPRCSRRMDTHPYAGPGNIVIDNCPICKVNWVDAQELRRVACAADPMPNPDA